MLTETDKYKLSLYSVKSNLHNSINCNIYLTQCSIDSKLYIKRVYKNSNMTELLKKVKDKSVRNTPKIFEIFYDDKDTIVIEEYVLGHTADGINFTKKLLYKTINEILLCIEDLHSINIIHRDIKPSNIMITEDHKIYLIDLGIARFYSDTIDSDTTKSGTKGFASPEQYGFQQTDFRSDIYSVGKTIESITKYNNINCSLNKIASKAASFDPNDRYSSAQALARAINIRRYIPAILSIVILTFIIAAIVIISLSKISNNISEHEIKEINSESAFNSTTESITEYTSQIVSESTTYISVTENTTISEVKSPVIKNQPTKQPPAANADSNATPKNIQPKTTYTPENKNFNILNSASEKILFTGLNVPNNTPYMEMLNDETHKTCGVAINGTYITAECIKNNSNLTVNLSDDLGHKDSLAMSFSKTQLENCDYPVNHEFNVYIYFVDYNLDGNAEIFVNFTDAFQPVNDNGNPITINMGNGDFPYILHNYNLLMLADHNSQNGFNIYNDVMVSSGPFRFEINSELYPGAIYDGETATFFRVKNGVLTESYQ